jgi:hypothetical protein
MSNYELHEPFSQLEPGPKTELVPLLVVRLIWHTLITMTNAPSFCVKSETLYFFHEVGSPTENVVHLHLQYGFASFLGLP